MALASRLKRLNPQRVYQIWMLLSLVGAVELLRTVAEFLVVNSSQVWMMDDTAGLVIGYRTRACAINVSSVLIVDGDEAR